MPIIDSRDESVDVAKDVKRHHDKIREAVKKKLPEIMSEEEIITKDTKGRKIRVPVRSIDIPDLRHGKRNKAGEGGGKAGMGQGPGKKGDPIGKRPAEQEGQGSGNKAGNQPGEEMIESEFTIEEIIEMMFEDLGLPNLQKKDLATIEINLGYKLTGSEKIGPMVLLKKRPTAKNAMKTFWGLMGALMDEFKGKRTELECFAALKKASGTLSEAQKLLNDPDFKHDLVRVDPFPIMGNDDLRFFDVQDKKTSETNAVVFAILDVSGSMSDMKKYIARAILFWMVQVLRKQYVNVEIRFVVHHTEARLVDEKDFFRTSESGGTIGHSAFSLVNNLIKEKYPTNVWNVYTFYFSDGEDWDTEKTAIEMKKMIDMGVNCLGFANIQDGYTDMSGAMSSNLLGYIKSHWPVVVKSTMSIEFMTGKDGFPFFAAVINNKKHVFLVLREFLKKNGG